MSCARYATELGWSEHQISVIDDDLARSAASTDGRLGFTNLVAAVGLGKAGIIVGREVSRLARNNTDWYQVLDLCSITDTLIADADGIYHPGDFNDRLVLGLKGQMAEAELHMLRMRLTAALRHKAAAGSCGSCCRSGWTMTTTARSCCRPDEAVRSAIGQVYALFAQLGSARQVMMTLRERGLRLPRRKAGARRITWAEASYPAVHDFLTNPAYAGAFAFGRTRTEKRVDRRREGGHQAPAAAAGPVGGADPRPSSRLPGLGCLPGHPGPAAGQLQGRPAATAAAPPARARRCCPACCAAASAAG